MTGKICLLKSKENVSESSAQSFEIINQQYVINMKFVFLTVVGNLFLANAFTSIASRQALERKTLLHASEQAPCVDDPK